MCWRFLSAHNSCHLKHQAVYNLLLCWLFKKIVHQSQLNVYLFSCLLYLLQHNQTKQSIKQTLVVIKSYSNLILFLALVFFALPCLTGNRKMGVSCCLSTTDWFPLSRGVTSPARKMWLALHSPLILSCFGSTEHIY